MSKENYVLIKELFKNKIGDIFSYEDKSGSYMCGDMMIRGEYIINNPEWFMKESEWKRQQEEKDESEIGVEIIRIKICGNVIEIPIFNSKTKESPDPEPPIASEILEVLKNENEVLRNNNATLYKLCDELKKTNSRLKLERDTMVQLGKESDVCQEKEVKALTKELSHYKRLSEYLKSQSYKQEEQQPASDVKELIDWVNEQIKTLTLTPITNKWMQASVNNYKAIRSRLLSHKYTTQDLEKCYVMSRTEDFMGSLVYRNFSALIEVLNRDKKDK